MANTAVVGTTHQFYESKIYTKYLEILDEKGRQRSQKYFIYFALDYVDYIQGGYYPYQNKTVTGFECT
jgi:hypothetical protein